MASTEDRKRNIDAFLERNHDEERQLSFENLTEPLKKKIDEPGSRRFQTNLADALRERDTSIRYQVFRTPLDAWNDLCVKCGGSQKDQFFVIVECTHKYHWRCLSERDGQVAFGTLECFSSCYRKRYAEDLTEVCVEQYKQIIRLQNLDDDEELRAAMMIGPGPSRSPGAARVKKAAYTSYNQTVEYALQSFDRLIPNMPLDVQRFFGHPLMNQDLEVLLGNLPDIASLAQNESRRYNNVDAFFMGQDGVTYDSEVKHEHLGRAIPEDLSNLVDKMVAGITETPSFDISSARICPDKETLLSMYKLETMIAETVHLILSLRHDQLYPKKEAKIKESNRRQAPPPRRKWKVGRPVALSYDAESKRYLLQGEPFQDPETNSICPLFCDESTGLHQGSWHIVKMTDSGLTLSVYNASSKDFSTEILRAFTSTIKPLDADVTTKWYNFPICNFELARAPIHVIEHALSIIRHEELSRIHPAEELWLLARHFWLVFGAIWMKTTEPKVVKTKPTPKDTKTKPILKETETEPANKEDPDSVWDLLHEAQRSHRARQSCGVRHFQT